MPAEKPYSAAAEQNKRPILEVLRQVLRPPGLVLEIGSGTGQHAVFFAEQLPRLVWQPTELAPQLAGLSLRLAEAGLANLHPALALDVAAEPWPVSRADHVFSANTAHIMHWPQVEAMFRGVGRVLVPGGAFCLYGPFNDQGRHTSRSNAEFDAALRARDPEGGLRDVTDLDALARRAGLVPAGDYAMPVNNRTLVWGKPPAPPGRGAE